MLNNMNHHYYNHSSNAGGGGEATCSLLISMPILIPFGLVVKQDSSSSAAYHFPEQFPSATTLFSRNSETCDMFVGQLQVDLVSLSCKRSQVPQVSDLFNRLVRKKLEKINSPIHISCEGLQQRSPGPVLGTLSPPGSSNASPTLTACSQQKVYVSPVEIIHETDQQKFWQIESFVEILLERLKELRLVSPKSVVRTPDLFVVVRRFMNDIVSEPLSYYSRFRVEGIQLGEIRLVYSKGTSQCPVKHIKVDPRFKNTDVSCRPIVCDSEGRPARYQFADCIIPQVVTSSAAAAEIFTALEEEDRLAGLEFLENRNLCRSELEDFFRRHVESKDSRRPSALSSSPDADGRARSRSESVLGKVQQTGLPVEQTVDTLTPGVREGSSRSDTSTIDSPSLSTARLKKYSASEAASTGAPLSQS